MAVIDIDGDGHILYQNAASRRIVGDVTVGGPIWPVLRRTDLVWDLRGIPDSQTAAVARLSTRPFDDPELLAAANAGITARSVTHDLNNLFTCILASASVPPRGDVTRHLDAIKHAVLRGAELLSLLRELDPKTGRAEYDVYETIEQCGVLVERVGAGVGVVVRSTSCHARVALAAHELSQIIVNLGLNAIEAMTGAGGLLEIDARRNHDVVTIAVVDTGPGIEPARLEHLFETGRSTKPGHRGIGLTVVRELVRRAGGTIQVESTPGRGSRFLVELRVIPEPVP